MLFCYLNSKIKSYSIHNKLIIFYIYLEGKKRIVDRAPASGRGLLPCHDLLPLGVTLDVADDIRTLRHDAQPPRAYLLQHGLRKHRGDAASAQLLGDYRVGQRQRAGPLFVFDVGAVSVDLEKVAPCGRVVLQRVGCVLHGDVDFLRRYFKFGSVVVPLPASWRIFPKYCSTGTPAAGATCRGAARAIPTASGSRRSFSSRRAWRRGWTTTGALSSASPTCGRWPRPRRTRCSSCGRGWATTAGPATCMPRRGRSSHGSAGCSPRR